MMHNSSPTCASKALATTKLSEHLRSPTRVKSSPWNSSLCLSALQSAVAYAEMTSRLRLPQLLVRMLIDPYSLAARKQSIPGRQSEKTVPVTADRTIPVLGWPASRVASSPDVCRRYLDSIFNAIGWVAPLKSWIDVSLVQQTVFVSGSIVMAQHVCWPSCKGLFRTVDRLNKRGNSER